ncbi:MAG: VPLPA-CTERM sorting domain-containing protein [Boseongicola sp.]
MNLTKTIIAAGAFVLSAGVANAATYNVAATGSIGTLDCVSCVWVDSSTGEYDLAGDHTGEGFLSGGDPVQLFNIDPNANSIANEVANLNELMGLSLDANDFGKNESGSWNADIGEGWLIFKFGQGTQSEPVSHLFVYSDGGNVSYTGQALSHVTFAGDMPIIPAPAAGFLLIGALGGLIALRRRKS